jgi:hypothetical protein
LTICLGSESDPNRGVLEVNPMADVPWTNLVRVCKCFKALRQPTDAEDSLGRKSYDAFCRIHHLAGPFYVRATLMFAMVQRQ